MIAEWDKLREVAVHKPSYEVLFGLINPAYFLFEKSFSLSKAKKEHDEMTKVLKEEGVKLYRLKKVLRKKIESDEKFKRKVKEIVGFEIEDSHTLLESLIMKPSLTDTGALSISPLPNLYFMRDQQVTVDHVIIGKMSTKQRERETEVLKLFWEALGIKYDEIKEGKLEGGDFFPMRDFYIVGVGIRSDFRGASNLFNLGEVALVYQTKEEFFHLDTYFNVPSSNTVVGVKQLMKENRTEVYYYGKLIEVASFYDYIRKKGFNIIEVSDEEARKDYITNFLTIADGKIVAPRFSTKLKEFDVITVDVENLTGGRGGIHCMTAVVKRE